MDVNQLFPMTKVGVQRIKEYKEELLGIIAKDKQRVSLKQFTFLCSGSASYRRIDGVDQHMGFQDFSVLNDQQKAQVKAMLERIYQIKNVQDLDKVIGQFSRYHQEYIQFTSFWEGKPLFDV